MIELQKEHIEWSRVALAAAGIPEGQGQNRKTWLYDVRTAALP